MEAAAASRRAVHRLVEFQTGFCSFCLLFACPGPNTPSVHAENSDILWLVMREVTVLVGTGMLIAVPAARILADLVLAAVVQCPRVGFTRRALSALPIGSQGQYAVNTRKSGRA